MTNSDCLCKDSIDKCDIFDFMAKYVGLSVLHPGGFVSTKHLLDKFKINSKNRILDIGLLKRFGGKRYLVLISIKDFSDTVNFKIDRSSYGNMDDWLPVRDIESVKIK